MQKETKYMLGRKGALGNLVINHLMFWFDFIRLDSFTSV